MAQPTLGAVTLPYPSNWKITPIFGENIVTTLSGKSRVDTLYRKYQYTLTYETLTKNEYESILNSINAFVDAGTTPTFTYDKIGTASSGISVIPRISEAERVFGAGNSYRISLTVDLLEVNSR